MAKESQDPTISKNTIGATYGNPYQAPYSDNDYSQNVAPPKGTGGGPAYKNPQSVVEQQFFNPATPNDDAFSDMQASNETSDANPIGQIMSDFQEAIDRMGQ